MKPSLQLLKATVVSPELLICLALLICCKSFPELFLNLSRRIGAQGEGLKYLGFFALGLAVWDFKTLKSILFPDLDQRKRLQKWSQYNAIKSTAFVGLAYAVLFAAIGVVSFFFDWKNPMAYQSSVLMMSVIGALSVASSFYLCETRIKEIFCEQVDPSK